MPNFAANSYIPLILIDSYDIKLSLLSYGALYRGLYITVKLSDLL